MVKYILKRLVYVVIVFVILSFLMFFLYNLTPGDPVRDMLEPQKDKMTPEEYRIEYDRLTAQLGLNQPMVVQYWKWFTNLLQGDFGYSSYYRDAVVNHLAGPVENTLFLNIVTTILALGITIPLGIKCAIKKNSLLDKSTQVVTIVGISIPIYITALVFIYFFAILLGIFPPGGIKTPGSQYVGMRAFTDKLYYMALPIIVATFNSLGSTFRYVRAAMITELSQDYIRTARAKGVREKVVIYSHAWRNALLPIITILISWFTTLLSGWAILEQMFLLQGVGQIMILGLNNKDYQLVLAMQMVFVVISLVSRLITDLSYGLVDPRVRVDK